MSPGTEIERKFLVDAVPDDLDCYPRSELRQGYLAIAEGDLEIRLRRRGDRTSLTIKSGSGRTRLEEELELPADQFDRLWPLTAARQIEKDRYEIPLGDQLVIELDRYRGATEGLLVAEVEFPSVGESERFEPPAWFGREVTGEPAYTNRALATSGLP